MNTHQCPKCSTEFSYLINSKKIGGKFCQNCGCNLEVEFIETPTCPKCEKTFETGTKFCPEDGSKLVSPKKLIPRCVKCGKEYTDGTKFCPNDGEQVIPEAHRKNVGDFVNKTNDTIANTAEYLGSLFTKHTKQWHGFVIGWAIFALIANAIMVINSFGFYSFFIGNLSFHISNLSHWGMFEWGTLVVNISHVVIVYGIILLLQRRKSGFILLASVAGITAFFNFALGGIGMALFGLLSIGIWYVILQIKKNDVTAWSTLE